MSENKKVNGENLLKNPANIVNGILPNSVGKVNSKIGESRHEICKQQLQEKMIELTFNKLKFEEIMKEISKFTEIKFDNSIYIPEWFNNLYEKQIKPYIDDLNNTILKDEETNLPKILCLTSKQFIKNEEVDKSFFDKKEAKKEIENYLDKWKKEGYEIPNNENNTIEHNKLFLLNSLYDNVGSANIPISLKKGETEKNVNIIIMSPFRDPFDTLHTMIHETVHSLQNEFETKEEKNIIFKEECIENYRKNKEKEKVEGEAIEIYYKEANNYYINKNEKETQANLFACMYMMLYTIKNDQRQAEEIKNNLINNSTFCIGENDFKSGYNDFPIVKEQLENICKNKEESLKKYFDNEGKIKIKELFNETKELSKNKIKKYNDFLESKNLNFAKVIEGKMTIEEIKNTEVVKNIKVNDLILKDIEEYNQHREKYKKECQKEDEIQDVFYNIRNLNKFINLNIEKQKELEQITKIDKSQEMLRQELEELGELNKRKENLDNSKQETLQKFTGLEKIQKAKDAVEYSKEEKSEISNSMKEIIKDIKNKHFYERWF